METHPSILGLPRKGPARRSLFGPVDRVQLRADCQASLQRDLDEASRRWGYDFVADRPLEQERFHWEAVPSAKVPLPYRPSPAGTSHDSRECVADEERVPLTAECSAGMEKTPEKDDQVRLKRKQTNITDFYQSKKRVVGKPRKSGQ
uniref:Cyclin dependent kinase inhibitor 1A n=1 Tax=Gadus morhua TaxID=8049 RepID=A0A8C5F602_GADMO